MPIFFHLSGPFVVFWFGFFKVHILIDDIITECICYRIALLYVFYVVEYLSLCNKMNKIEKAPLLHLNYSLS